MPRGRKSTKQKETFRDPKALIPNYNPESYKDSDKSKSLRDEIELEKLDEPIEEVTLEFVEGLSQAQMRELHKAYTEHTMTPSQYFNTLKDMRKDITDTGINHAIDITSAMLKKAMVTRQKTMAEKLMGKLELYIKERGAIQAGYTTIVNREDVEAWIEKIHQDSQKSSDTIMPIRAIELENYTRDIPDDVIEKIAEAQPHFERFWIVFTDYTGEVERQVEKAKKDKDPILFGGFVAAVDGGRVRPTEHLYFIADWVDDHCDLTLDQMIKEFKEETSMDMKVNPEAFTTENLDEIREYFNNLK